MSSIFKDQETNRMAASRKDSNEDQFTPHSSHDSAKKSEPPIETKIPVFQWEIIPEDPELAGCTANVSLGEWDYAMWWQKHNVNELVYVSIQALQNEDEGRKNRNPAARKHPVGNNVVVNLVYDVKRKGIVAIYGTASDFRPFVEVFIIGYGVFSGEKI